jgi:hypothetical protein
MGNSGICRIDVLGYSIGGKVAKSICIITCSISLEVARLSKSLIDVQKAIPPCVSYMVTTNTPAMWVLIHTN